MKKVFFFILPAFILLSCKKDKDTTCATTAASIAGAYKITAATYKSSASAAEVNYYTTLFPDACERDDVYTFNINGAYQKTDAGIVCSPPDNYTGTWSFSGTTMIIDGDPVIVESFNCQTLVVANTDIMVSGDKLKLTLSRQ